MYPLNRIRIPGKGMNLITGLIFLLAVAVRLFFNFSQELIPGINGGYYPLQVRCILDDGFPGFADMPLLFYLDAGIIRLITLFGIPLNDFLILYTIKIIDSLSIPMLLIPLSRMMKYLPESTSGWFRAGLVSFAVLSFSPLTLVSDLQKNALGVTFTFFFLASLQSYLYTGRSKEVLPMALFLILTGLTHYGTLLFALFFLVMVLGFRSRFRAILPILLILTAAIALIGLFDYTRLERLFQVGYLAFEKPVLLSGMLAPPDLMIILISMLIAIAGIRVWIGQRNTLSSGHKGVLMGGIISLLVLSFPLLDGEYFQRLSLFLFIPQILVLLEISMLISVRQQKVLGFVLLIAAGISVFAMVSHPREPVLTDGAYRDLQGLRKSITPNDSTLVIARHGLEWWTAWALHTKVAQDKAMDKASILKYNKIFILQQISGMAETRQRTPFHEPRVPSGLKPIYSTGYFRVYQLPVR